MKLSQIPGVGPSAKLSLSVRKSTFDMLKHYQEAYSKMAGIQVALKDVLEQMVLDFMRDDKEFQKYLKTVAEKEQEVLKKDATSKKDNENEVEKTKIPTVSTESKPVNELNLFPSTESEASFKNEGNSRY